MRKERKTDSEDFEDFEGFLVLFLFVCAGAALFLFLGFGSYFFLKKLSGGKKTKTTKKKIN